MLINFHPVQCPDNCQPLINGSWNLNGNEKKNGRTPFPGNDKIDFNLKIVNKSMLWWQCASKFGI